MTQMCLVLEPNTNVENIFFWSLSKRPLRTRVVAIVTDSSGLLRSLYRESRYTASGRPGGGVCFEINHV